MTVPLSYPGVYIQELQSTVHTITGVATSITAFVGRAVRGPVNQPVTINSIADFERTFGGLWNQSYLGFAVQDFYLNGGSQAIVVRLYEPSVDVNNNPIPGIAQVNLPTSIPSNSLTLDAASPGIWGNNVQVTVTQNSPTDPIAIAVAQQYNLPVTDFFNLTVVDTGTNVTEQYNNLTVVNSPVRVDQVLLNQSNLVLVSGNLPTVVPATTTTPAILSGGLDGQSLKATTVVDPVHGLANKTGIYALEHVDLFNLLCIPPYANSPATDNTGGADIDNSVLTAAAAYCKQRRAFFIVDAPAEWHMTSDAVNNISSLPITGDAASYAALYFPRVQYPNVLNNNQLQTFVPCGMVAGIMANTDAQRGVWKAPAGIDAALANVTQFTVPLTNAEIGQLNPLGINCLRNLPAAGPVVWGARTRLGDDRLASQWKYVPVRRLALYIEESLYRGTQWVVFEPNDEPLWAQIRLNVGSFMNQLFRQGAFQGMTSQQAYFVKCDSDTTTQADINNGIVNVLVGFAPLKPAEFVVISIQQMAGNLQA